MDFLTQSFNPPLRKTSTQSKSSISSLRHGNSTISLKSLLSKNASKIITEEEEETEQPESFISSHSSNGGSGSGSGGNGSAIEESFEGEMMIGHGGSREGRPRRASTAKSFASARTFNSSTTTGSSLDLPDTRFSALRTYHSNSSNTSSPSTSKRRKMIAVPERKKGDWACYGRVVARVVVLQPGALGRERSRKGKIRIGEGVVEWVLEGTLWITKANAVVFVINQSIPPTQNPKITSSHLQTNSAKLSLLSLLAFRRPSPAPLSQQTTTPPNSGPGGGRMTADPIRNTDSTSTFFSSTSSIDADEVGDKTISPPSPSPPLTSSLRQSSRFPFFSRSVVASKSSKTLSNESSKSSKTLIIDRNATINPRDKEMRLERTKSGGTARGGTKEEEVESLANPFENYNRTKPISALLIPTPKQIRAVRNYPKDPSSNSEKHRYPRVELEIGPTESDLEEIAPLREEGEGVDEGREVLIGFEFLDILLASEAEEFKEKIEAILKSR